jgi:predicted transposase YbfD/YdcC
MPKRKTTDKEFRDLTQEIDVVELQANIKVFFEHFPDPRNRWVYPAWYLILMMLCGYLSGCNTIADIAHFAEVRNGWLNSLLGLNFQAVSYDTIWWFLVRVKPSAFKDLMSKWLQALPSNLNDQLLAVDGKRLRGISDNEHITHLVELFAIGSRIVVAQERVPDKACERAALPALLQGIDVRGAIISMDAHYLYTDDLQIVVDAGADYMVGIKGNQGNLQAEVRNYFEQANEIQYDSEEFKCHTTIDKGHGRVEIRHVCVTQDLDWLPQRDRWKFKSLVEVRSERIINNESEHGILYYGSSRLGTPEQFANWARGHWDIENGLHYIADVIFEEDASLVDTGYAAENMGLLRRLTMNIIHTVDPKRGMADARRSAMFEPNYLRGLLSRLFMKKC